MKSLTNNEWFLLTGLTVYSLIPAIGGLLRVFELMGGPVIMPDNPRAHLAPTSIILHVIGSTAFCLLGALQLLPSLRQTGGSLHRRLGRIAGIGGCASALTGMWMTHSFSFSNELQGELLYWVRMIVGVAMLTFISFAMVTIRKGNARLHGSYMIRAFALAQGASTQAFTGITWMIIVGSEPAGLHRDVLMTISWLINLCVAEIVIRRYLPPRELRKRSADSNGFSISAKLS